MLYSNHVTIITERLDMIKCKYLVVKGECSLGFVERDTLTSLRLEALLEGGNLATGNSNLTLSQFIG